MARTTASLPETAARIEAALRKLSPREGTDREQTHALFWARRHIERALKTVAAVDHPKVRPISRQERTAQRERLANLVMALYEHLKGMHTTAISDIERRLPWVSSTEFYAALT